ncbi:PLDc N-terminal domain-containing protein [Haloarchaeobius sp. TZWSO28]|uniref:PLDc N-terminal domain-containing protein n=1 Tax=Haloarchaeobius sp. TZWSO28 TaxID=3446119 RepID=UPI003EB8811A
MAGEAIALLIAFLSFLVFAIVLPLWTYNDAQKNSSHSPFLWALVVFFGALLGLLLYFIVGRDQKGGGRARSTY